MTSQRNKDELSAQMHVCASATVCQRPLVHTHTHTHRQHKHGSTQTHSMHTLANTQTHSTHTHGNTHTCGSLTEQFSTYWGQSSLIPYKDSVVFSPAHIKHLSLLTTAQMTVAKEPKMNMWFLQYCIKSALYHRRKTFHSITLLVKNVFRVSRVRDGDGISK